MITLPELLQDERYKKYFTTAPKMLKPLPGQLPWRVLVQRRSGGPWAKKECETYADAFGIVAKQLRAGRLHDGTIQSRGIPFGPPQRVAKVTRGGKPVYHTRGGKVVRDNEGRPVQKTAVVLWQPRVDPSDEQHQWCTYCRRPTVFRWFNSHHALRAAGLQELVDPTDRRCTICGAREEFIRRTYGTARPPGYDPISYIVNPKRPRARK